jgi:predicted RecA/RadA family phage recombinase
MTTTATRTEQVQAQDIQQGDLIQMGERFAEVLEATTADYAQSGRLTSVTFPMNNGKHHQTIQVLPSLTLTRVAV